MRDYYKVLGVSKTAKPNEIKAAYRKLIHEFHPDRNRWDSNAVEMAKMINEAYAALSDSVARANFDQGRAREQERERRATESPSIVAGSELVTNSQEVIDESVGWSAGPSVPRFLEALPIRFWAWIGSTIMILSILLITKLRIFILGFVMTVQSDSMTPVLQRGDVVSIQKYKEAHPRNGDIVVYNHPRYLSEGVYGGRFVIHRIVAIEGEVPKLANEIKSSPVPANKVFVLADNLSDVNDSRTFGPVPINEVRGRIRAIIRPKERKRKF